MGVVRPVVKTASTAMEQIDHRQLFSASGACREDNAILHVEAERGAMKGDVAHNHFGSKPGMIGLRLLFFLVAGGEQQQNNKAEHYSRACRFICFHECLSV